MNDKLDLAIINPRYVVSAVRKEQYPVEQLPEIAFLGRSNVGKSSLINALCNQRGLAKVSGAPGKTRTVNFFSAVLRCKEGEESWRYPFYLVDLPGYGFARTSGSDRERWSRFIGEYIRESKKLKLLCLLVDLRHPGLQIDRDAYEWLHAGGVVLQIVGTKADKLNQSDRNKNLSALERLFPAAARPIAYSALKQQGRSTLLGRFLQYTVEDGVVDKE